MAYDILKYLRRTYAKTGTSQSTSDPFSKLLSDTTKPREIVFRGEPKDSNGTVVNVDLSASGYTSQSTDTPYQHFPPGIEQAYNFTVGLPLPDLWGSAQIGVNATQLINTGGALDSYCRLDWLGARNRLYLGPLEPAPFSDFTKFVESYASGLSWNLAQVQINNRDLRFKLQRRLQTKRYKGFGAAVRFNGTTTKGIGTLSCPAGSMAIGCRVYPSTTNSTARFAAGYRGNVGGGLEVGRRHLSFRASGSNVFSAVVCNDAGTSYTADYNGLPINDWYDAYLILDVTALKVRLYVWNSLGVGGLVQETTVTGTFNTVRTAVNFGYDNENATAFWVGDLDEYSIWNTALTLTQILGIKDRQLTGGEANLVAYWKCDEGSGTSMGNTVPAGPAITLTAPTWIGSLEGDSSLEGVVKPVGLGVCRQVLAKLVDPQRLVYQVHDGSMQAVTNVKDSGDLLTFGADVSDIYSATPAAGTYNTCLAKGLIRLGSSPIGTITADIKGANGGTIGYAESGANMHRKLMVDYGGLNNMTEIDDTSYVALNALNSAVTGEYFDNEINIDSAADVVLRHILSWGSPSRTGISTVGRINDPANQTATVVWTRDNLKNDPTAYTRNPLGVRYKEIQVGYKPYYTTLSPDQVAGAVGLAARYDFGKEYRYVSKPVPGASVDADVLTVLTSFDNRSDAIIELDRLIAFLSRDLESVRLLLVEGALSYYIGTIVSVLIQEVTPQGLTISRYGGLKNYVIVRLSEAFGQYGSPDTIEVECVG